MNTNLPARDDAESQVPTCWFCGVSAHARCDCGRAHCVDHGYESRCLVCAFGLGMFEEAGASEPVSDLIVYSLSMQAGDPYILIPAKLTGMRPLPLEGTERLIGALVQMLQSDAVKVRHRAAVALAATTNSWPTMNPSPLDERNHGTGLLVTYQVRRWLLHVLKLSRGRNYEPTAAAILDKLRIADFRNLYPSIQNNLQSLAVSTLMARVREVFDALADFYPTHSPLVNERCELAVYEHYSNPVRGAAETMKGIYGPLLRYSPILRDMLKKGTWLSSRTRYREWYYGEEEPSGEL
jgi:hypothetical protein